MNHKNYLIALLFLTLPNMAFSKDRNEWNFSANPIGVVLDGVFTFGLDYNLNKHSSLGGPIGVIKTDEGSIEQDGEHFGLRYRYYKEEALRENSLLITLDAGHISTVVIQPAITIGQSTIPSSTFEASAFYLGALGGFGNILIFMLVEGLPSILLMLRQPAERQVSKPPSMESPLL